MGVHISLDVHHWEREPNAEDRVGKGALVICCCAVNDPKLSDLKHHDSRGSGVQELLSLVVLTQGLS